MAINALADANFDTLLLLVVMLDVVDLRLYIIRFIIIVPILSMLFALHPIDVPAIFTLQRYSMVCSNLVHMHQI